MTKTKKLIFVVSAGILIPAAIVGTTYLALSSASKGDGGGNGGGGGNDGSLVPDPSDGKINMGELKFLVRSTDDETFKNNIKIELNNIYQQENGIDFEKFEIENLKPISKTRKYEFTAKETEIYNKTYDFKFEIENLSKVIVNKNIGEVKNYQEKPEDDIKILSTISLYINNDVKNQKSLIECYNDGLIKINTVVDQTWNDPQATRYLSTLTLYESDKHLIEIDLSKEFKFFKYN